MKVVSYLQGVPRHNKNLQKTELLKRFIEGVSKSEDIGVCHDKDTLIDADVAVLQGWVYNDLTARHLQFRKAIIDKQRLDKKLLIIADANCFGFTSEGLNSTYIKYSFDGIFPTTGNYCDKHIDPNRWKSIAKALNLKLHPYIKNGTDIIILMQRSGGWSLKGIDNFSWCVNVINNIRKYSQKPIIVRAHPGDRRAGLYINKIKQLNLKNVKISQGQPLLVDLQNGWAVVNHNSSAAVGPIIYGYHCFLTDPVDSQCKEVAHHNFENIENPQRFDREQWVNRLAMFHWNFFELSNGQCWKHMRSYI